MTARCSIVIANAGSGKTWTLANRFIAWAIQDLRAGRTPEPARALAVTFTRKAAGEILARILAHAAQGAAEGPAGDKARAEFAAVVGPASRDDYLAVLKALCGELHRLQVGTIDGFFHRIATAMPGEVGLPADWTLGDDRQLAELRARAAAEVLAHDEAAHFIDLLERGEPKPSVTTAIESLLGGDSVTPLDIYRATEAGGADAIDRAWNWAHTLVVQPSLTEAQFKLLVARAERLVAPASANGAPDKRWVSALEGVVDCLRRSDFRSLAASGFFLKMHRGESYYGGPMPPEFTTLAGEIEPHLRKALVAEVAKKLEGALTVLPIASAALARVQREQGVFGFADIGRGVSRAASDKSSLVSSPETLRDAIGADIRDLAIDEAQDTSVEQYKSMRPLLEEVLAGVRDGRFLLVGDPKQSIYGWRGGTPGLIAHIETAHAGQLGQGDSLTKSYRSSPLVMDFVNRVFGDLGTDLLALVDDEHKSELVKVANWVRDRGLPADCTVSAFKRAVAAWPFARHESAKPKLGGRLAAYAYGKTKEDGDQPAREVTACACAAAIAARIHREAPERSIGILVRSNKEITQTVAELKALGVAASDEGRATLLDSPAVQRVAALLRLIDDPGDRISHFLVSRGAMQAATGLEPLERHGRRSDATRAAEGYAARCRAEIADVGLAEFLRGVYAKLAQQGLSARDAGRLARVIAIAEDFADRPPARLVDFLDAVAADKADSSSSDRIRVMTVHKSKGLEFDEVVAISLDEGMGAADADWGVLATSPIQPPVMVSPLTNAGIREWVPELAVFERDERRRALLDDLSRLYVALTRARQGLHLVMKIPSKSSSGATLPTAAKLIVRALDAASRAGVSDSLVGAEPLGAKLAAALPDAEQPFWTHSFGSMPSANAGAPPHGVAAANADAPPHGAELEPLPVQIVRHRAARAAAPSMHADDALSPWRFDPFRDDNIALRGVLVHECFREVETARDLATAEQRAALVARAAIRASVEKGEPVPQKVIDGVLTLLERVALGVTGRALRGGGDVRVRTELPFVRETPGGLVHGRIDRLELDVRDGKVVGATIIDFKTGATGASASDLAEIKRGYFEQLDGYAEAVEEMFGVPKSAISRVLLFVDRDERHG